ncbi:MAG: dethiobiotin synthase [Sulfurimonas sp.]|nr:dethiobiotin synthase [Sulfurimonas sp.]
MKKQIFVTATNTDIGKTYVTKLLLKEYASRGFRVGAIKPIETGVVNGFCPDGKELLSLVKELNKEFKNISVDDIVPIQYKLAAAPFVASNNTLLDLKKIDRAIQKLEKLCDILIVEGAGGLYVPIDDKTMMIDLINYLDASTLLVSHCSLGCINDTLLSKKALESKGIKHLVAFNPRGNEESFAEVSAPYFEHLGFNLLKVNKNIDTICDVLYNL